MSLPDLSAPERAALGALSADLREVFGTRLRSLVLYRRWGSQPGPAGNESDPAGDRSDNDGLHTLALVERVTFDDLARCAPRTAAWRRLGLAVPLMLTRHEFERTLDVFPLEYGNIIASHVLVLGEPPFAGVVVAEADRRRACEWQAKSHLIHLREGFLESAGDARAVARLVAASAPAFRALLANITNLGEYDAALDDDRIAAAAAAATGVPAELTLAVLRAAAAGTIADPGALFARYVEASERIWHYVDGWSRHAGG